MDAARTTASLPIGERQADQAPVHWQRASRREIVALCLYFAIAIAAADALNVRTGVEFMTLALLLAAAVSRRLVPFLRDWWFFLVGLLVWGLGGPIVLNSPFPQHLDFMLNVDTFLLFGHNPVSSLQHALLNPNTVGPVDILTIVVYKMHLPEPFMVGYVLWRLDRAVYFQFAAVVLIFLIIGFITMFLFPAVPPWMASEWLHRVPGIINRYRITANYPVPYFGGPLAGRFPWAPAAAVPSQHAGFPLIELLAFSQVSKAMAVVLAGWVALVLFTVVYLGEHWVTDALVGWVYAAAVFFLVRAYCRRGRAQEAP